MIPLTHQQQLNDEKSKYCHICKETFYEDEDDNHKSESYHKVRDHCHYTGEFGGAAHNRLIYKCKKCDDIPYKSVEALKEKFSNTYRFCNKDTNKFILLLRKGVYPCEYMDMQIINT